jgi:TonB family protein
MSASIRFKLLLALLTATFAFGQDRSDPAMRPDYASPRVVSRVEPNFPEVQRREPVMLMVTIDAKGLAQRIRVVNSHDLGVDKAAINAVQKWRFQPAARSGVPVEGTLLVSFPVN